MNSRSWAESIKDAGNAGVVRQRVDEGVRGAVDDVHPVGAGVGDVQAMRARPTPIQVGVVEPWVSAGGNRDEPRPGQAHP